MSLLGLRTLSDDWGSLNRIAEVRRRCGWTLPLAALLGLIASIFEGAAIGLLIPLLDELVGSTSRAGSTSRVFAPVMAFVRSVSPDRQIVAITGIIFGLVVVKAVVQIGAAILSAWVESSVGALVRERLVDRLLAVDYLFLLRADSARVSKVVSTDTWRLSDAIGLTFSMAAQIMTVLAFAALLMVIQWQLFAVVGLGMVAIRSIELLGSRRVQRLSRAVSSAHSALGERVDLIVGAARPIRLFGQQQRERERAVDASERFRRAIFSMHCMTERMVPTLEVLQTALFILIVLAAGLLAVPLATAGAFLVLLYRIQLPLLNIGRYRLDLAALRGSTDEIADLLEQAPAPSALPAGRIAAPDHGDIRFEGVSFCYQGKEESPALDGIDLTIRAGMATAIVGRSGSGKSTLINLLCGLIQPRAGRILVGGVDLRDIDPITWRRKLTVAGQDIDLIDETIAANIAYAVPGADSAQIEAAARAVDAHDFIMGLPLGYATPVGARGLALSGGQRQKIGLARALLRRPEILILDEATNSMDGISAEIVQSLIVDRNWFHTVIVISHSASAITACDEGVVLEYSKLVDAGPMHVLHAFMRQASDQAGGAPS